MTYGATLQALHGPDRQGRSVDVTLGFDRVEDYEAFPSYFGATIGRYANRIGGARFSIDGQTYAISRNDGDNSLGFDKKVWRILEVRAGSPAIVRMALTSPDGDQGYPGRLEAEVTYSLSEAGELGIEFRATTDAPTVVNLTNHALFNMAGEGSVRDVLSNELLIPATHYTPVDAGLIPTGERRPVAGTPFDFRRARVIAEGIRDGRDAQIVVGRGIDHNYALDAGTTEAMKLAARLSDPGSVVNGAGAAGVHGQFPHGHRARQAGSPVSHG
jgi:aldose 1-epimerase